MFTPQYLAFNPDFKTNFQYVVLGDLKNNLSNQHPVEAWTQMTFSIYTSF